MASAHAAKTMPITDLSKGRITRPSSRIRPWPGSKNPGIGGTTPGNPKRPPRHFVETAVSSWAGVDSNRRPGTGRRRLRMAHRAAPEVRYRPQPHQAVIKQAKSRQNPVIFTGRTVDLPLFPQFMPGFTNTITGLIDRIAGQRPSGFREEDRQRDPGGPEDQTTLQGTGPFSRGCFLELHPSFHADLLRPNASKRSCTSLGAVQVLPGCPLKARLPTSQSLKPGPGCSSSQP